MALLLTQIAACDKIATQANATKMELMKELFARFQLAVRRRLYLLQHLLTSLQLGLVAVAA